MSIISVGDFDTQCPVLASEANMPLSRTTTFRLCLAIAVRVCRWDAEYDMYFEFLGSFKVKSKKKTAV